MENLSLSNKKKFFLCATIMVVVSVFSFVEPNFIWVLNVLGLSSIIFLDFSSAFTLFVFLLNFEKVFDKFSIFTFLAVSIILFKAIVLFKDEKWLNKSKKFKVLFLISFLYLLLQPLFLAIINKGGSLTRTFNFLTFLFLLVLVYFAHNKLPYKKIILSFAFGTILASALGLLLYFIGICDKQTVFIFNCSNYTRFMGLSAHPNTLERYCILGMIAMIVACPNCKKWYKISIIAILALLGFFTYSKTFIILIFLAIVVLVAYAFIKSKNKKEFIKYSLYSLIALSLLILICYPYLKTMFSRFFGSNDSGIIDSITTGRNKIWSAFWKDYISSPISVLFGNTLIGRNIPIQIGTHSTYLSIIYSYGIVGIIFFAIFIYLILKETKLLKNKFIYLIPIMLMLLSGLVEDQIYHSGFFFIPLAVIFIPNDVGNEINLSYEFEIMKNVCYLFFKRLLDVIVALVALILLCIPMLFVGVLVKATSKGPIFFKDKRVGKDGKNIIVLKFRSMYVDAESRIEQLLTKEQYEIWKRERKVDNDPRITKLGKFIRKTSIDELPQLINILKGDLSLVGNRPLSRLEHETHFNLEEQKKLNSMRPGLTGYWQVYGRSGVEFSGGKRQKMYLKYIENKSFWYDIKLFIMTFWVVLTRKGAK